MTLSTETLEGWKMTGTFNYIKAFTLKMSFLCSEIVLRNAPFLLQLPGAEACFLLSEHFRQDPLESYFGD